MRTTRGKVQKYLGMTLDLRTTEEIGATMVDYLKGVLEDFLEVITLKITIQAANHMFKPRPEDEQTLINGEQATAFHHTVAQLIFFASRARKDIKMKINFLCNQVRIPDKDEWGKLVRVLR